MEIVKGVVWNGQEIEIQFWNILKVKDDVYQINLTWQQFPQGSKVIEYIVLYGNRLSDSKLTVRYCELLLKRIHDYLQKQKTTPARSGITVALSGRQLTSA